MLRHYLKIAIRNLLKYKTQSFISIIGLAIGLSSFALSSFWVQYEMSYDSFHKDANRIYLVRMDNCLFDGHYMDYSPYALTEYLRKHYSDIEDCCAFGQATFSTFKGKQLQEYSLIVPDSTFIRMMNIKVLEGNDNFFRLTSAESNEVAVTEKMAQELFGTTQVLGKTLTDARTRKEYRIGSIVSDWGKHSNFPYFIMGLATGNSSWNGNIYRVLIKVKPGTDIEELLEKMNLHFPEELKTNQYNFATGQTRFYLEPITNLRYADEFIHSDKRILQFKYIVYFSLTGALIIICAFVNYLTIYSDRFRSRKRDMALRKISGASEGSLLALLSTDFILTILLASVVGMVFIELLMPWFIHYSMIEDTDISLYGNCLIYIASMAVVALIIATLSVYMMRRHSLHNTILNTRLGLIGRIYHKGSIIVQLTICLLFIFCSLIMQMQLYHLRNVDTGMEYHNRAGASIWMNVDMNVWAEKLKTLPMITEVIKPIYWPIISMGAYSASEIDSWDGLEGSAKKTIGINMILGGEEFFRFYNMELLAGEWISEKSDRQEVNIMESTARRMGWTPQEAIGKHFSNSKISPYTIVGVIKDCAYKSPTADLPYTAFVNTYQEQWAWSRGFVLFKYKPGTWEECRLRIEEMQQTELPDKKLFLFNEEEQYNKYLSSEDALSALLSFSSVICILISIFGIYSLVTLSCEQRRKEIAIRKVNGATINNILSAFFKEYMLLLAISSLIAFPIGYAIMQRWIETYNRQVEIGILPFAIIFIGIAAVIAFSIGHRVWKAAQQNPAEAVKSE